MDHPTLDTIPLPELPPRDPESHKGDFGRVLIVAGSRGMSGAAVLCGRAALRGGAGLVRVAVPGSVLPLVALGHPCLMTAPLLEDDQGRLAFTALSSLLDLARGSTVLAIGPGLGKSHDLERLLPAFLEGVSIPLVLDADGLNAFLPDVNHLSRHGGPVIITPHPGEFARLANLSTQEVQANRRDRAAAFAQRHNVIIVLKGHQTIVTDGAQTYVNTTGNPGMATGGSGDVLTGLLAALLGQGLAPFPAAQLAAFVHGLAGDYARDRIGEVGLLATDLIKQLPRALREARSHASNEPF